MTSILIGLSLTVYAAGSNYYVSKTSCSDSYVGSEAQPWCTIQHAVNSVGTNDIVNVSAGTYTEGKVSVNKEVVIRAMTPAVVGGANSLVQHGFLISSSATVEGFEIGGVDIGSGTAAINITSSNVAVRNNYIHDLYPNAAGTRTGSYEGVRATGAISGVIIEGNTITRMGHSGINVGVKWSTSGGVSAVVRGNTVSYCAYLDAEPVLAASVARGFVASNDTWGVNIEVWGDGCQILDNNLSWGWQGNFNIGSKNSLYHGNTMHLPGYPYPSDTRGRNAAGQLHHQNLYEYPPAWNNVYDGNIFGVSDGTHWEFDNQSFAPSGEDGSSPRLAYITNNVFLDQTYAGAFMLYDGVGSTGSMDIYIDHNTFLCAGVYISGDTANWADGSVRVTNNIFAGSGSIVEYGAAEHAKFDHDYNLYATADALPDYGLIATNEILGDPLFFNSSLGDYHLQSSSPAINAGIVDSNTPPTDKDGNPRVGATDIGAYEYQGAGPTTYILNYTAGANGIITGTTPQTVASGGSGTAVTATPIAGYHFVDWSDSSTSSPRTDINVTANISVTANFAINTYTVTASSGTNGSVTPSGVTIKNYGSSQSYAITPSNNYHIVDVLVDSVSQGAVSTYNFTNIQNNHTISVSFAINTFILTTNISPVGSGVVLGSGTYNYGTSVDVLATPLDGYAFANWSGDCTGASSSTIVSMVSNKTCIANFNNSIEPPVIYDISDIKRDHSENGVTFHFNSLPAGVTGINIYVTILSTVSNQIPLDKTLVKVYELHATDQDGSNVLNGFDSDVAITYTGASDLDSVYYWDSSIWSQLGISNVVVNKTNNTASFKTNHFSEFAILGANATVNPPNNSIIDNLIDSGKNIFLLVILETMLTITVVILYKKVSRII